MHGEGLRAHISAFSPSDFADAGQRLYRLIIAGHVETSSDDEIIEAFDFQSAGDPLLEEPKDNSELHAGFAFVLLVQVAERFQLAMMQYHRHK